MLDDSLCRGGILDRCRRATGSENQKLVLEANFATRYFLLRSRYYHWRGDCEDVGRYNSHSRCVRRKGMLSDSSFIVGGCSFAHIVPLVVNN